MRTAALEEDRPNGTLQVFGRNSLYAPSSREEDMDMKIPEQFRAPQGQVASAFAVRPADDYKESGYYVRGDVFFTLRDAVTREVQEYRELRNLVVLDASILIARLMKDNLEPPHSLYALAIGSGDTGWNPMSPPAATNTQRALYAEITRKTFTETAFIDGAGVPVAYPTKVVDFTTIYTESEAVGPLVEMGLLGGNISTNMSVRNPVTPPNGTYDPTVDLTTRETLCNYLVFPVINKPATSTLEIVWRLSF